MMKVLRYHCEMPAHSAQQVIARSRSSERKTVANKVDKSANPADVMLK